jgi:hypothetical protein
VEFEEGLSVTISEVDRVLKAVESGAVGTYSVLDDGELERDPRPDCEYGPCGECLREHCPERAE